MYKCSCRPTGCICSRDKWMYMYAFIVKFVGLCENFIYYHYYYYLLIDVVNTRLHKIHIAGLPQGSKASQQISAPQCHLTGSICFTLNNPRYTHTTISEPCSIYY